jgi:hypothetical protein
MTFGDIFSEINLDSSIIYVIILTNLIFLASKLGVPTLSIIWSFRPWHTCNYEWYRLYRSYENCRRPGVAILDMQMSKVPIISGYAAEKHSTCLVFHRWVLCSFAYLRWRRRDVCNFHMIYIDDIIPNCMCVRGGSRISS